MRKYNYLVTDPFTKDKCRRVYTILLQNWHFKVGKYDMMYDIPYEALYIKTPKLGLLVSFVEYWELKRNIDNGKLNEDFITSYLREGYVKEFPKRAEEARQYLLNTANPPDPD